MPNKLKIDLLDRGPLSKAESRALCEWLTGDSHKVCAGRLFISIHTMEMHIKRIKDKLDARNAAVALKTAEERGMVRSRLIKVICIALFLAVPGMVLHHKEHHGTQSVVATGLL